MIAILVVDDHPVFLDGVAASLARVPDFSVVGVARTGEEAVQMAQARRPDVVLMDLNLPGISGVEATRRLTAADSGPRVLVLTMVDDDETVLAALRAGAAGYILKGSTGEEIAAATRTAASGGAVFGPGIAARILAGATGRRPTAREGSLTDRERDVLTMIAGGSNNAQIARALGLSLKTVQNYVSRVLDKLQVADRTQAAILALGQPTATGAQRPVQGPRQRHDLRLSPHVKPVVARPMIMRWISEVPSKMVKMSGVATRD